MVQCSRAVGQWAEPLRVKVSRPAVRLFGHSTCVSEAREDSTMETLHLSTTPCRLSTVLLYTTSFFPLHLKTPHKMRGTCFSETRFAPPFYMWSPGKEDRDKPLEFGVKSLLAVPGPPNNLAAVLFLDPITACQASRDYHCCFQRYYYCYCYNYYSSSYSSFLQVQQHFLRGCDGPLRARSERPAQGTPAEGGSAHPEKGRGPFLETGAVGRGGLICTTI